MGTLQALYRAYSSLGNSGKTDSSILAHSRRMSVGEWISMLRHIGLLDMGLVNVTQGFLAFTWSRIRTCVDYSDEEEMRLRHLQFEDFMEALLRLASVMALPTDEEVTESGTTSVAEFLLSLRASTPVDYKAFVAKRTLRFVGTNTPVHTKPHEGIERCFNSLMSLIVTTYDGSRKSVSREDALKFMRARCAPSGKEKSGLVEFSKDKVKVSGHSLLTTMRSVESNVMDALAHVPAFSGLSTSDLHTLRDAMSIGMFEPGASVMEQGERGDTFYLITTGHAEVLYADPADPAGYESCLTTLGPSDCFGELALLRNEPRAASVVADGRLFVLSITRDEFQAVLGPLSSYMKGDNYTPPAGAK